MYDRRVIRGNTYAIHTLPTVSFDLHKRNFLLYVSKQQPQPNPINVQRQQEAKRRALVRRKIREQFRTRTPEPVHHRKHIDVQTELYLEELR